jgi:hypothetical protein
MADELKRPSEDSSGTLNSRKRPNSGSSEERLRSFLVYSTIMLMFSILIAFIVTRDATLLLTDTIIGGCGVFVYRYYFPRK